MKKNGLILMLFALMLYCAPTLSSTTNLLSVLGEKTSWEFLYDRLIEQPPKRVTTYFEQKLHRFSVKTASLLTLLTGAMAAYCWRKSVEVGNQEGQQIQNIDYEDRMNKLVVATVALLGIDAFLICLASWRNRVLVRGAEKEIFLELLKNQSFTFNNLPRELVPVFQTTINLQANDPAAFERELPTLIDGLKKEIRHHKEFVHR